MKVIEILKLNRSLLVTCKNLGIRTEDVQYIELYNDYHELHQQGEKVSYIVAFLSEKYQISERQIYILIKKLRSDCKIPAAPQ